MKKLLAVLFLMLVSTTAFAMGGKVPAYVKCTDDRSKLTCEPQFGDPRHITKVCRSGETFTENQCFESQAWYSCYIAIQAQCKQENP